jgi:hypothetical protein
MFGSDVLEIAIGLFFVYSMLSVISSAIAELIEAKLKLRARDLEKGLRGLLADPEGTGLVQRLYEHPLIYGLFQGTYKVQPGGRDWSNLPSYIPARNFALALIDTVVPANREAALPGNNDPHTASELRSLFNAETDSPVHRALASLLNGAGTDITAFRQNVENWYDSTMDRVAGWYKRRTQIVLLCIGVILAIASNADTLGILTSLSQDRSVRASLVAAAQEYAKQPVEPSADPQSRIKQGIKEIQSHGLPWGWNTLDQRSVPDTAEGWLTKLVGWLLTGIAISLGAPFWFDLLNRIMVIRSTVKPHEKSPEEPSIDR